MGVYYDFSVDYYAIAFDHVLDIHIYLMKKNNIIKCLGILKGVFMQD